ncbi:hypothetical protein F5148DRAFT_1291713 [Russula earlei]|uniref:Uncharacterized protein n=1 Tax=Russula earlei TaxID=71964 RepID=A0ACC0TVK4_9AGAM|nr:hypothetical protein F5148DRAFT_1291713 [Russula earlei]
MKKLAFIYLSLCCYAATGQHQPPHLEKRGQATQLIVDGKPFLVLGGELYNSSASSAAYLQPLWAPLQQMHLNTILASVSWQLIEPEEGRFDFSLVDAMLQGARVNHLHLVLLWFGTWKNGLSHYTPDWVKRDTKRFPRMVLENGASTETISPLSENANQADAKAFAALMHHVKATDGIQHTVIMVQVENEVGLIGSARDHSERANTRFEEQVPMRALQGKPAGTWAEVYGHTPAADEAFMAWHYARYLDAVAVAGKAEYNLPMYVNTWIVQPEDKKPGDYPSGGPQAHVHGIWKTGAPHIDIKAPDIYLPDFTGITSQYYHASWNPLFIPESFSGNEGAANAFYAIGKHNGIGYSPFGIDKPEEHPSQTPLAKAYDLLQQLTPQITAAQSAGEITAVSLTRKDSLQELELGGYRIRAALRTDWNGVIQADKGYGLIIHTGEDRFIVAGADMNVTFVPATPGPAIAGLASVWEGRFVNSVWKPGRLLNGDDVMISYHLAEEATHHQTGTGAKLGKEPAILQAQVWQRLTNPTAAEMRAQFQTPPIQYAQTMDFGVGRNLDPDTIAHQLDLIHKQGINAISIEGVPGAPWPYLSEGYMKGVQMIVSELKKRGMHLWIIDEGQYPSGFAGGLISEKAPELRMQALVIAQRITLKENEGIDNQPLDANTVSAVAVNTQTHESEVVDVSKGALHWAGRPGNWQIVLAEHRFKTAVTRSANNPKRVKDTLHSLIDYLNPAATRKWMEFTHEQYKQYVGNEFGKTILGFRGDEPEFGYTPWTPELPQIFQQKKGYDIRPYLASFLIQDQTPQQKLAKADFWDVWSDLFRDNYFKIIADWCAANGLEYTMHIDHEDQLMSLVRNEGDFFKTMRYVQIPGVDAIWHQIWYDNAADFPKLASSAAHMYGRPRSLSETFAAYTPKPTVKDARWVLNEEMVRGINFFEYMNWGAPYLRDTAFPPVSAYINRATWLLANGKPAATIALYCPTESMWLGNKMADSSFRMISKQLLEHQLDFDMVDRQGITSVFKLVKGKLVNASGQAYSTVLLPNISIIPGDVLNKLKAFAAAGGKVLFMDGLPQQSFTGTFAQAKDLPAADLGWASSVEYTHLPEGFYNQLPEDVRLGKTVPGIKYQHRQWKNADLYFFFNEGESDEQIDITVEGKGKASWWDADTGLVTPADEAHASAGAGQTTVPMRINGFETKPVKEFVITDYGAISDTTTINTLAIQKAIDACTAAGGGVVVIPKGNYLSGAIFLKQNVSLRVDKDGVLKGSVNPDDYPAIDTRWEGEERKWSACLVNADGLHGIRLYGEGTIDGSGEVWTKRGWKGLPYGKPRLIGIQNCKDITIEALQLHNQASWCLFVLYSKNVKADKLHITADHNIPSSDGMDFDSDNGIHVTGCFIDVNDDCISIKSGKDEDGLRVNRPSENILIENCVFGYGHGGVAMGSETSGGIRNVLVQNCTMEAENWAPIRFKTQPSRSGVVENITYKNIKLINTRKAVEFNMAWRMVNPRPAAKVLPVVRNIQLINISGTVKTVGDMHGLPGSPIDGVKFTNCELTAGKGLVMEEVVNIDTTGLKVHLVKEN